jgi:hypothetical protein
MTGFLLPGAFAPGWGADVTMAAKRADVGPRIRFFDFAIRGYLFVELNRNGVPTVFARPPICLIHLHRYSGCPLHRAGQAVIAFMFRGIEGLRIPGYAAVRPTKQLPEKF